MRPKQIAAIFLVSSLLLVNFTQVKSLYYGESTSEYKQSGYMITNLGDGKAGICGINFVGEKVAITAAHCIHQGKDTYADTGEYDEYFVDKSPQVSSINRSPNYNLVAYEASPGLADVGVVTFAEAEILNEYAFIASPQNGCNYYLVGYGHDQNDENLKRTGTDTCITNITDFSFELTFDGKSHFCNGDSGSGIYQKGTNKIVGVVSAFYTAPGSNSCEDALAFVAARLDYNLSYLKQYIPQSAYVESTPVPEQDTVPNDYFGDEHPETRNEDGTYNYNNEILLKIQELDKLFGEIYPEQTVKPSSDMLPSNVPSIYNKKNQDSIVSSESATGLTVLLAVCCCLLIMIGVVVGFIVLKNKKSTTKTN